MTQETFVSRVTFVNNKTMQTTFAKLKRTNILYVASSAYGYMRL